MPAPASPPPLSNQDTYTTWPGGVDPTARVYDSIGGKRVHKRRGTPKRRYSRKAKSAVAKRRRQQRKTRKY